MKKSPAAHHARPGLVGFVVAVSLDESEDRNLRSFHGRKEGEHPDDSRARAALDQIEERVNHFLSSYDDPSIIQLKRVPSTSAILGSMMPPIKHWSHSSLMSFLRNPLAWYKRYVEEVYDTPSSPSSVVGRGGHVALQHFYGGIGKEGAIQLGLEHIRNVPDFEINFGKARSRAAKKKKRLAMEREYLQAISFYLARPPRHDVLGVEVKGIVEVEGLPLPLKAVSDLVVRSKVDRKAVDIVDHKFVDSFSSLKKDKPMFVIQAIFNYYTVRELFKKPVRRFIVQECRKKKNADGSSQMRRYVIDFADYKEEFALFHRLIKDATAEISRPRAWLPNPSDMFEGDNSFDIYRLGLIDE